jgi:glycerate dehydrogenase
MKIVVLDGFTLNPGDLTWDPLRALGECVVHDRTPDAEVVRRSAGAEVLLTNKTPITGGALDQLPSARYIGVLATGFNIVDVEAARSRRIVVTNVPGYSTYSVAQLAFAHILHLTHHVAEHSTSVRSGEWTRCVDFSYAVAPLIELSGLTLGIVGYGRIGKQVGQIGEALGMKVLAHDPSPEPAEGVEFCGLDDLFRRSDVVTLHCPLTPESRHIVNRERLLLMKGSALLINTSRGPLVDEQALALALNEGVIAGAGLDVLTDEPPHSENPLLKARNCTFTPHVGWATRAARKRLLTEAAENLRAFLAGHPRNVVS